MPDSSEDIKSLLNKIDSSNKELSCLYKIDEILRDFSIPMEDVFMKLIEIIPEGWQNTEICRVQIDFKEQVYKNPDFKRTELRHSSKILIDGKPEGEIQICYIRPVHNEKGIFLPNERLLLKSIAQKISDHILYRKLRESIENPVKDTPDNRTFDPSALHRWLENMHLKPHEIETMTSVQVRFKKGEIICKQGAITSYIMILAEGLSKNYLEGNQSRGFNFSIVKPFEFIGLSSLYNSQSYLFSGSAITPCIIYHIEREKFIEILMNNQAFSAEIMQWYCRMTEGHLNRMSCLANKQALGRVADILIYLYEKTFSGKIIENIISRKDIADLAGMSTESAVRILSELNRDHIIKIHHNGIEVSNLQTLKRLSQAG